MDKVRLIISDISHLIGYEVLNLPYLSYLDKEDIKKYKVEQSRIQKAVSYYLKRKYIGDFVVSEHGKPLNDKVYFNVSHSNNLVVLGISSRQIGVDIEEIRPFNKDLINFVFSSEEAKEINDEESFFRAWTSKEALSKAEGEGIASIIKEIPTLPLEGIRQFKGQKYRSKQLKIDDYICSICLLNEDDFEIDVEYENI